jgi:hypothetical protein
MKKNFIRISSSLLLLLLMLTWNGCDEFNSLPLNIPFTLKVHMEGVNTELSDSTSYCLSTDSDTYNEYKAKIKSLHFVEAAYRTLSVTPADLSGDIAVTLNDGNNNELFHSVIQGVTPADYMKPNSPYILPLTQEQIDLLNEYLNSLLNEGACFTGKVTVNNISGNPPFNIDAAIDMVIEADMEY